MLKKRYVFLIIILFLFSISAASASDNITADVVGVADVNVDNSLNDDIINVNEFSEDVTDNQTVLGNGNNDIDSSKLSDDLLSSSSYYPSYSDYSVSVSDTSISYGTDGSSGYITMNIIPSSTSTYKYYYYLRIYDSNDNQKISQLYSSTSSTSSKTYSVSPNQFSPGTYTVKIVNYYDNRVMDTAKLTISNSCPSYSDYSVSVSDITIASKSGGSISMSISPASDSKYKYDFYLKVYDSC